MAAAFAVLIAILFFNYLTFNSKQIEVDPVDEIAISSDALERFAGSIKFETISFQDEADFKAQPFIDLHAYLAEAFPLIDSLLKKEVVGYSLLYTIEGRQAGLPPVVLMSHLDVVPVDMATIDGWEAPPFSGAVKDGKIYGRGTMDDKVSVLAIMEAVEMKLQSGWQPERTIYLAFGHDEEIGGEKGAKVMAEMIAARGPKPLFVVDEGGYVAGTGMVPGLEKPLAVINIAEKGYLSFELTITTKGGHSSAPPADNTIGSLASAITKLESNQFPYRMIDPVKWQIEHVGPEMPFVQKLVFANHWLFGDLILAGLTARTTTAPTMFNGGVKDNVIPSQAKAVVNFRILQGDNVEDVRKHIIKVIDDERITLKTVSNVNEPSAISSIESAAYKAIEKSAKQVVPGAVVSPGLVGGGTDAKHYEGIAENSYRFFPVRITPDNMTGFHGINEHLLVDNYYEIIRYYFQLMENIDNM